jgi:hypothetical protein
MTEHDDFMTADLARAFREGADDSDSQRLLKTAASIVESEATARGCEEWQLLQRRQEIDSPRVQRALDVLIAGGFLTTPTDEDHEHGGESG